MLKKMVDGKEEQCSSEEESHIRAWWEFNNKYPEYLDCHRYDGASLPVIDLSRARELHVHNVNKVINKKLEDLKSQVEKSEDDGDEELKKSLLARRKMLKSYLDPEAHLHHTFEEMYAHLNAVRSL